MNQNLSFNQEQLNLPDINLIESSELAFSKAFLKTTQIMCQHFEHIKLTVGVIKDFTIEPFNLAILGLFSKMCRQYYSYVLLEIHHDWVGSQILSEHLQEATITLVYLLEEADRSTFSEYVSASVYQALYLVNDVENQLQQFPNHPDLLILRRRLNDFINNQQNNIADSRLPNNSGVYLWGSEETNTTASRAAITGLNFLNNPTRQIALKVMPASWLDIQLHYLNYQEQPEISFKCLRDAAHLCLHTTQVLLEEVINYQDVNLPDLERQQKFLNALYEWFHNAYRVYQQKYEAKINKRDDFNSDRTDTVSG